jgi:hypothetical protein
MADGNTPGEQRCDGIDHGVPEAHVPALVNDAYGYNRVLQANEMDGSGKGDLHAAFDAGKAFYQELVQLPVGERRALLHFAQTYNSAFAEKDPAMPTLNPQMDSDGFLEKLKVKYPIPFYSTEAERKIAENNHQKAKDFVAEFFDYQGWGMCTQFKSFDPDAAQSKQQTWPNIELPTLRLFK